MMFAALTFAAYAVIALSLGAVYLILTRRM